jgi:hypothetical protein
LTRPQDTTSIAFRVGIKRLTLILQETFDEIDPSAIVGRRTRGARVDYTSKEALEKAGLKPGDAEDDEEDDVDMQ